MMKASQELSGVREGLDGVDGLDGAVVVDGGVVADGGEGLTGVAPVAGGVVVAPGPVPGAHGCNAEKVPAPALAARG